MQLQLRKLTTFSFECLSSADEVTGVTSNLHSTAKYLYNVLKRDCVRDQTYEGVFAVGNEF